MQLIGEAETNTPSSVPFSSLMGSYRIYALTTIEGIPQMVDDAQSYLNNYPDRYVKLDEVIAVPLDYGDLDWGDGPIPKLTHLVLIKPPTMQYAGQLMFDFMMRPLR
ncbi:MAG: hypothetical protein ABIH34_04515 [Nanoarchaeota archaeon]